MPELKRLLLAAGQYGGGDGLNAYRLKSRFDLFPHLPPHS